ncbi:protein BEAN1 [Hippopotamus amphibius kiboko]|uniref:protein BEAN1 n=1 Tax=Hippopotamus amphibius kiboko TaxID=575201 RepID=UPI002597714E|nr:protein BEAN1 [Hippopotamus amphibius kiboko]
MELRNDPGGGPALLRPRSRGAGRRQRAAVAWAAARGRRAAGRGCGRARAGKPPPPPPRPGIAGTGSARPGSAPPRPAPPRPCAQSRLRRSGAPPATPEPEPKRSGIQAGTGAGAEPEREPELEPKLEPAVRRTERSEAAKPTRYNRTSYFYPTFSESSEHSHLLVSPVLVASAVIGVVIILSCITIIVGSIRRDRQARLQRRRRRHRRHRRRRRRHREYEHGYVFDGHTYSRSSHRMRYACSPAEDWPPPLDLSSDGDVDATALQELYPDSPPGYEECMGPGATQLYVPTDAPPPYSLTDSCPELDGVLDAGSGHSPSQHQQAQRLQGQSGLRTVSMDTLPPYEAVCGASPPSGLLPLPGPEPGLRGSQGSPAPTQALASGPERIM